ncbi:MAG: hypothetical protein ACD_29C00310G0002 [uncultured bacterium]|nr:MAG: hypothetical protein ACD_29C00310G0002 [uncultured bacterium]
MNAKIQGIFRLSSKQPNIISLMLLGAFASMGAIIMTPALPKISDFFGIRIGTTQLAVTSFLFGYALGQLLYGPIANAYGRKFALYVGLVLATIGSVLSIVSSPVESFPLLVVSRFLEALGASAGLAISITIINDFYFEDQARRMMTMLMLAFSVVPGVANAIGGSLVQYLGWQSCFYFLLLYGFILILPTYCLAETLMQRDLNALQRKNIVQNYGHKFKNIKLVGFAMLAGLSGASIYVFGAEGPFIGIHLLHYQPSIYGLLALTPFIGMLIGNIISLRFSYIDPIIMIKIAFLIEFISTLMMFTCFLIHDINIYTLLIPMGLFAFGHPALTATALALSTRQFPDKANVSAVANFVMVSMPVLMTFLLSMLHAHNAIVMPIVFLIALTFMVIIYICIWKFSYPSNLDHDF